MGLRASSKTSGSLRRRYAMRAATLAVCAPFAMSVLHGCGNDGSNSPPVSDLTGTQDPGGLVQTKMNSTVGVLLDEIPAASRDAFAQSVLAKPADFWIARAHRQIDLTTYRLVFRETYYAAQKFTKRMQLPLPPPPIQNVTVNGPARRTTIDGHDLVVVDYTLSSMLVTDAASPGISEPKLASIGGTWSEPFTFPVDPELVFQRTRFACMDEAEFPPTSVDSEEVDSFYDDSCKVEKALSQTGCHQTELPTQSCVDAVKGKIGHVSTTVDYTRLPWDAATANTFRVGPITNTAGSNLTPEAEEFRINRITYRYFAPSDCALVEQCVGAPGWRRLLQFATADRDTGTTAVNIGSVDYFNANGGSGSTLTQHNVFEYSACHKHYHFRHYGNFSFNNDQALTHKRGFCLQSTNRLGNNEVSPLWEPYGDCSYQGISVGWVDEYKVGLPCQWIDVTTVDTSKKPVTGPLTFVSNPDGFLCEGTPVLDASGNPVWEPTSFKTETGAPVDRMKCNFYPGWLDDNTDSYNVTIPAPGEGYVTAPCLHDEAGPLRNCALQSKKQISICAAGAAKSVTCTIPAGSAPQVVRVCDVSMALATGIPCTYQDSLANVVIGASGSTVSFNCPASRSATEPGGHYSLYTGALNPGDATAVVTCQ
jgi:hypothetical protein